MKNGHLGLFFDDELKCTSPIFSYGHDIEAAWLMDEAAHVLGDKTVIEKVKKSFIELQMKLIVDLSALMLV